jgi:uncharacterized membrane protein
VLLLYSLGLLLAMCVEFVFVVDVFFTRKNTMFKLYYEVWVLWGVASAYVVYFLWRKSTHVGRGMIVAVVSGVIGLGLVYPVLAIATRLGDSIAPTPMLDAMQATAFSPRYPEADDTYAAAQWFNQNVVNMPIILEATDEGTEYKPARSRLSSWTGLPVVLGWYEHETQWRGNDVVQRQRLSDITLIYSTTVEETARTLLQKYDVRFILVGNRERKQYPAAGLAKFDRMFPIVFQHGDTKIYRVP